MLRILLRRRSPVEVLDAVTLAHALVAGLTADLTAGHIVRTGAGLLKPAQRRRAGARVPVEPVPAVRIAGILARIKTGQVSILVRRRGTG